MADEPENGANRLRDPRFPARLEVTVTCREWVQVERLVTLNASRGGLFLRANRAPDVESELWLEVKLPEGTTLSLRAIVIHTVTPETAVATGGVPGFGVKFHAAHERDLILLESMARAETGRPPATGDPAPRRVDLQRGPVTIARMHSLKADEKERADAAPSSSKVIVGIDYGTTYSSIATVKDGHASLLRDAAGRTLVPSIVSYPASGGVLVGWDARDLVATDPGHTIHSAKRLLGRHPKNPEVASQLAQQAYRADVGPGDQVVIEMTRMSLSIPQIVAEVLRLLKRTAERALDAAVDDAVLTVPVTFGVAQRNALRKAAELAGLRTVGLIEEPAAAGLAYGFGHERNEIVAVYDFSGGTFDFTLIDISRDVFRILVSAGDAWLGGDDFDLLLAKDLANRFWKEHSLEIQKRLVEWQRLIFACEAAKRTLSRADAAAVRVPQIARNASRSLDLDMEVTRARFDGLCGELVRRSLDVVDQALRDVDLEPSDVGQVVITGGCTRIPMVRAAVSEYFGRGIETHVDPDEAVALGAAVQASLLANRRTRLPAG